MIIQTQDLIHALQKTKKHERPPWFAFDTEKQQANITIFPKSAAAMRVITISCISEKDSVCFEIIDAMRAFFTKLIHFREIKIEIEEKQAKIICESPTAALQYHFNNIKIIHEQVIEPHKDDVHCKICTQEWFTLWNTIPIKGTVDIECSNRYRPITLKHSRNRWAAAIHAVTTPTAKKKFKCDSGIARSVIVADITLPTFSTLTFMHCGVLKWTAGPVTVYLAPIE